VKKPSSQRAENAPTDAQEQHAKPQSSDYNLKGFLIEMRNNTDRSPGEYVDHTPQRSAMAPKRPEFAMIIEENSPHENKHPQTLDSSRINSSEARAKPMAEFNKMLSKFKQLKFEEKRTSSPTLESGRILPKKGHKRVKSDVPQNAHKKGTATANTSSNNNHQV